MVKVVGAVEQLLGFNKVFEILREPVVGVFLVIEFTTVTLAVPPAVIDAGLPVITGVAHVYPLIVGNVGSVTVQLDPAGIPVTVFELPAVTFTEPV
jgi:hypothetical protein